MIKNIFLSLSSISFIVFLIIGIYILLLKPKSNLNRNFLYFSLSFALWSFGYIILFLTDNIIGIKIGQTGAAVFSVFILRFFLYFTDFNKLFKNKTIFILFNLILWIIPAIRISKIYFLNNTINDFYSGIWPLIFLIYTNLLILTSIIILIIWGIKSKSKREKKQVIIIIIGAIISIITGYFYDRYLGLEKTISSSNILIWILCIWFAIIKYKFLSLTPEYVSSKILSSIDEYILLINNNLKIIFANQRIKDITGSNIKKDDLNKFIENFKKIEKNITALLNNKCNIESETIKLIDNNKIIVVNINYSIIKDKYNDIIGVLIIGKEIKGIEHLKRMYKITNREIDIILLTIAGKTYNEISNELGITVNTTKRHITNIYNKLFINNKVELMTLLNDFVII